MVVVHHATHSVAGAHWIPFGGAGVDIFFVISGFVMAHTTRNAPQGFATSETFILRRIARIVPLYWLAILWTTRRNAPDLNLLRDFFFVPHHNEQMPAMINPIVVQGWTLNYEMLFYVMFGSCLLSPRRYVLLLGALLVLPMAGGMLPGVYGAFYGNTIVYEFGFGVVLQLAVERSANLDMSRLSYLCLVALGFVGLILGYDREPRWLYQGLPAVLVVWSSLKACEGWLRLRPLALLGDASYSIYLFHWASFGAIKPLTRLLGPTYITTLMLAHIAAALIAGCVIHLAIENRITNWSRRLLGASNGSAVGTPTAFRSTASEPIEHAPPPSLL